MARDAESHAADDRKRKDEIEARNRADAMVYNTEKTLKEHRDKISEAEAKEVEAALENTKKAMADGGLEALNAATDRLTTASHKLAEAMYKAQSAAGPNGAGPTQGGPGATDGNRQQQQQPKDDVVDAEFVDVEDKK
jgi:molecular chaperone DnaK